MGTTHCFSTKLMIGFAFVLHYTITELLYQLSGKKKDFTFVSYPMHSMISS